MTPRTTPIRVLLAATDEQLRTHVRAAFGPAADVEIVAEADTDAAALALARRSRPDVVLLDGSALLHVLSTTRRLLADPGLDATAVEELIRYDPPLQLFERTAVVDTVVAGHPVPAGTKIAALLGAAARDPAAFARPDEMDVARQPNPHLGFGAGVHYCLGAPLARVEVAATLDALRTTLPDMRLAAEPPRRPDFVMRGLRELRLA
jgi:unspecific monooxygenase